MYEPKRKSKISSKWWCTAELEEQDLGGYYRWWMSKQPSSPALRKPSYPLHISIVRGEKPKKNIDSWGYLDGLKIKVKYMNNPHMTKMKLTDLWTPPPIFLWVSAESDVLKDLREFYGLETAYGFHITLAKVKHS